MRAAVVTEPYKVEIQERPVPQIGDKDVLIQVHTAGVCGSDIHLYRGTHAFRKPPAVLGHELAGEIVEVGKDVTRFKVGDRVTVEPHIPCGQCSMCQKGYVNLCENKIAPGTPKWIGSFCKYFNAPEDRVYKLADNVSYECGTLIEPLAVSIHALNRIENKQAKSLAIIGCGTIGLMALVAARKYGFEEIYCTDVIPFNLDFARKIGATKAFNSKTEDCVAAIKAATGGKGVDAVIVAAGAPNIIDQASEMAGKTGEVILVAMITEKIPVYTYSFVFGEQTLRGAMTYQTADFAEAAALVNGGLDMYPFITQRFPMEQTGEALKLLSDKTGDIVKIIVNIQE